MQEIRQPAPQKRVHVKRLTPQLKALPIDLDNGIKLDLETAKCIRVYAARLGWIIVQRRDGDDIIVWRIG